MRKADGVSGNSRGSKHPSRPHHRESNAYAISTRRAAQETEQYLPAFVRYLLVVVAMVSVAPVLSLFTGMALAAPGVTIPDDNLRAALAYACRGPINLITPTSTKGYYNFCWDHCSFRIKTGAGTDTHRSPIMALAVTQHSWSVEEMATFQTKAAL